MVVLDTNIVSELMRGDPSAEVLAWMDSRPARELFVTVVTDAEIRTGIATPPEGVRRRTLGRPISQSDCQIAAIARMRSIAVAMRNVRDFGDMGVDVIDRWKGP